MGKYFSNAIFVNRAGKQDSNTPGGNRGKKTLIFHSEDSMALITNKLR